MATEIGRGIGARRASCHGVKGGRSQVKPWQEVSPCGGARHIPRGIITSNNRNLPSLAYLPSFLSIILALPCPPLASSSAIPRLFPPAYSRSLRHSRFYVLHGPWPNLVPCCALPLTAAAMEPSLAACEWRRANRTRTVTHSLL